MADYEQLNFHGQSLKPLLTEMSPEWPRRAITTDSQRLTNPVKMAPVRGDDATVAAD